MLYVCSDITKFQEFSEMFRKTHEGKHFIDMSKVVVDKLIEETDSIVSHHRDCVIFLGYLEPGWMLSSMNQTRIRKLFRKFHVGMVTYYMESLPFSWKNEIDTVYTYKTNPIELGV
jgi:hypothetical protein